MAGRLAVGVPRGRQPRRTTCAGRASRRLDRSSSYMTHEIPLERRTLHGHFSRDLTPILTIQSGETVAFSCLDSAGNGAPGQKFEPREEELDQGHALVGPIEVR